MLYLLGALFVVLQFMQLSNVFATAADSGGYQFGKAQALDRASVSVVRLVAGYSSVPAIAGCAQSVTGLGVLVGSWATTPGSKDFSNWVLTDGSLVDPGGISCGQGKPMEQLSSIKIYANSAYSSSTNGLVLKSLQCHGNACSNGATTQALSCQNANACDTGVVLVPFHMPVPQPFIDLVQTDQTITEPQGIELTGPVSTPISVDQAVNALMPIQVAANDPKNEPGMPLINANGQLVDMNTKAADTGQTIRSFVSAVIAPTPLKPVNTNALHDNWNRGIDDYYNNDFVSAQSDFIRASAPNTQFLAPAAFLNLPQIRAVITPTPPVKSGGTTGTGGASNTVGNHAGPFALPGEVLAWFPWIIGGAILLIVILVLVVWRQVRHSQLMAAFEKERAVAEQQVVLGVRHAVKLENVEAEKQQQPTPQLVKHIDPTVNFAQENYTSSLVGPLCPHCHQPILTNAAFCTSCGFPLYPLAGFQTSSTVLPANYADALLPESLPSVQPPHESAREQIRVDRQKDENVSGRLGQRLGNYHLIRLLGEGGFAEVYLGEHIHLGSLAAIKVLHNQLTSDGRERFLVEARTLVRLVHPHIVRVLDFGIEDKTAFLVMDFAANGTLRERHPNGTRLSLTMVKLYVQQVADALQFAHNQKIIHRDIKPENMLVGQQNTILLSDFGIATIVMSSRYQNIQDMAGTIAYMAPEQIQSHPRSASDQYALGVVVYEWLCGTRPFHGSFTEVAAKHAMASPPPLRKYVPELPTVVEEVVLRALAKDPRDRFTNVQAFAHALAQAR